MQAVAQVCRVQELGGPWAQLCLPTALYLVLLEAGSSCLEGGPVTRPPGAVEVE